MRDSARSGNRTGLNGKFDGLRHAETRSQVTYRNLPDDVHLHFTLGSFHAKPRRTRVKHHIYFTYARCEQSWSLVDLEDQPQRAHAEPR